MPETSHAGSFPTRIGRRAAWFAAAVATVAATGCATPSTHPALVTADAGPDRPPLLPLRHFIADADRAGGFLLSRDGTRLVNSETVGLDHGLVVRDAATGRVLARYPVARQGRTAGGYAWLADSRHLVFATDPSGSENVRLFVQDTDEPTLRPWEVTPWPGTRSVLTSTGSGGATLRFVSNRRVRESFDVYEADALARTVREVARNDGRVRQWILDADGEVAARIRATGPGAAADRAIELARPDGTWTRLRTIGAFDTWTVARIDTAASRAWVVTTVGRDRGELVEVDLANGAERVLAADDVVDVWIPVFTTRTGPPAGAVIERELPRLHDFDTRLAASMVSVGEHAHRAGLIPEAPVFLRPLSVADSGRRMIVRAVGRFDMAELIWEPDTGRLERLDTQRSADAVRWLSPQEPFSFVASDGRRIHGLLIRPRGVTGPVPMVVDIHGGPWQRDHWETASFGPRQLLANRGYAVLQVNFRGSAGYGRDHMWAGAREAGGRVQRDIAEAVQWAVDAGVADRSRIGVMGASFGGYSVLMQLIAQPHPYRCGVDQVGVADWARVIENWPPFWANRHWFERFYGRVEVPAEREAMRLASPVAALDRIAAPLLVVHGGNDVRVLAQDSIDVVRSLRARGHPVTFLMFPDEGHAIVKWPNRLAMWREIEDLFAACLGGRSGGYEVLQLVPSSAVRDPY